MPYLPVPPGRFFGLFRFAEIVTIKASNDPMVIVWWEMWQNAIVMVERINLGSAEIQAALAYLAATNQSPPPATAPTWAVNRAYTAGATVSVGTNVYICATAGTSAATGSGPSGVGAAIADGTCVWTYTPTPYLADGRVPEIIAARQQ